MNLEIKKEINLDTDVNFNIYKGTKVVNFSGGTDSTLVLYLLMNYCDDDIIAVTKLFGRQHLKNLPLVTKLTSTLMQLTQNWNIQQHIIYKPGIDIDKNIYHTQFNIDVMYTGVTQNPPLSICKDWKVPINLPDRQLIRDVDTQKNLIYNINNHYVYSPFINVDKKTISKIYQSEGLMDVIFPLTNSCTEEDSSSLFHCGECWWCQERKWAFGKL